MEEEEEEEKNRIQQHHPFDVNQEESVVAWGRGIHAIAAHPDVRAKESTAGSEMILTSIKY